MTTMTTTKTTTTPEMPVCDVFMAGLTLLPWPCRLFVWLACLSVTIPLDLLALLRHWGLFPYLIGVMSATMMITSLMPPPLVPVAGAEHVTLESVHGWGYTIITSSTGAPLVEVSKDVMRVAAVFLRGLAAIFGFFASCCELWAAWT